MDQGVFLIEIEVFREPVEGTGVIVFYIDRKRDPGGAGPAGCRGEENQDRPAQFHRAGLTSGFLESLARNSTREMQVSCVVPGCTFLITSFTVLTGFG